MSNRFFCIYVNVLLYGVSVDVSFEPLLEPLLCLVLSDSLLGAKTSSSVLPEAYSSAGSAQHHVEVQTEDT
jgi:hypothetical protein